MNSYATQLDNFYRDIFQEHVAECGFQLNELCNNFHIAALSWHDALDTQAIIFRHVDAIYLHICQGFCSKADLLGILQSGDEDETTGLIYALSSIGNSEKNWFDLLLENVSEFDDDALVWFSIGVRYGTLNDVTEKLISLLSHEKAKIRALVAEIIGYRGGVDSRRIWPLFRDDDQAVKIAAMVAMARSGFKEAVPAMEQAVLHSREAFNEHCLLPLLMLGSHRALQYVQIAMRSPDYVKPQYPIYLALAGNQQDYPLFLHATQYDGMLLPVVEALGIFGSVQAVDFLQQHLLSEDDELKLEAAKSLNMISGANLKETVVIIEQAEPDLEVEDVIGEGDEKSGEEQGDSREVEVQRHCTDHTTWMNWWQNNVGHFDPHQRYRFGKPYTFFTVLEEIARPDSVYNDRQRAYYELVIRSGHHIPFEPDWFADKQIDALKKWQLWWNENKSRYVDKWLFAGG